MASGAGGASGGGGAPLVPARTRRAAAALAALAALLVAWALPAHGAAGPLAAAAARRGRPIVVAHRGASGPLPEHTAAAYWRAISDGADFIECDVQLTADFQVGRGDGGRCPFPMAGRQAAGGTGRLGKPVSPSVPPPPLLPPPAHAARRQMVCRHEQSLNATTDAAEKFPDRVRTYTIDGAAAWNPTLQLSRCSTPFASCAPANDPTPAHPPSATPHHNPTTPPPPRPRPPPQARPPLACTRST
jgi:hypothetical protein